MGFCSSCDTLPSNVCLRPGFDIFAWMEKADIKCPVSLNDTKDINEDKSTFLTKTAHAIVRHQHRLDGKFYNCTLKKIHSIFLGGNDSFEEEATQVRCHQILCEILAIMVASHGLQMAYLAAGEEVPELPSIEQVKKISADYPAPKELNMMSLLKTVHRDSSVSDWSPYYSAVDIDLDSPKCETLGAQNIKSLQIDIKHIFQPRIALYFAPIDTFATMAVMSVLYINDLDKGNMGTFSSKCGGINRFQLESVAAGYTGAVDCSF